MKTAISMVVGFICLVFGTIVGFYGFAFFMMKEPKFQNWVHFLGELDPDRAWIVAGLILLAGIFLATAPLTLLMSAPKNQKA